MSLVCQEMSNNVTAGRSPTAIGTATDRTIVRPLNVAHVTSDRGSRRIACAAPRPGVRDRGCPTPRIIAARSGSLGASASRSVIPDCSGWASLLWATAGAASQARGKSVLLIFQTGAPSQIDTLDTMLEAPEEVRGTFRTIATNAPGVHLREHLPRLAAPGSLHDCAVVDSRPAQPRARQAHDADWHR